MPKEKTDKNDELENNKNNGTFIRMEPATRGKLETFRKNRRLSLGAAISVLLEEDAQRGANTNIVPLIQSLRHEFEDLKKEHRFQTEIIIRSQATWIRKNAQELAAAIGFTAPLLTPKDHEHFENLVIERMEDDSVKTILYGNVRFQEIEKRVRNGSAAIQTQKDKASGSSR